MTVHEIFAGLVSTLFIKQVLSNNFRNYVAELSYYRLCIK